jgi:hypothetical protein
VRWTGHVERILAIINAYRIFVIRPEGKRSLGRPRHGWKDNVKMNLKV